MKFNIKHIALLLFIAVAELSCKDKKYEFGDIVTPSSLNVTTAIDGVDTDHPNGGGSGKVQIDVSASNAMSYNLDYGDGVKEVVSSGKVTHKYSAPGTFDYILTVSAVGTGGATSTASKKLTVFVDYIIPEEIVQNLTNGSSQTWVTDRETVGHVGVGPVDTYTSDYYSATPNQRAECLYDDLITFSKDASNGLFLSIDNKGTSFLTEAATAHYGKSGGDNCYDLDVSAPRKLAFMEATSGSTSANSTRVQFKVPGNGLINFGTGGDTYEIIALSATKMTLRSIGSDGLAWYQKLKVK